MMKNSIEDFIEKYELDDFSKPLELNSKRKIEFYNDLMRLFKTISRIFDKTANIASLRGFLVLMGLAKLSEPDAVINKSDIKDELNIDRLESIMHAFEYLEKSNYIKIIEKTPRFHVVRLNKEDNPDLELFQEILKMYWRSPKEQKEKIKSWREKDEKKT